jgi:hypothetical protein
MPLAEALAVLGLAAPSDESAIRRAFRSRLRDTHPDLNTAADATDRTVTLTVAYQVALAGVMDPPSTAPAATAAAAEPPPRVEPQEPRSEVHLLDDDTIAIAAPAIEVVPMLIEAAHQLGDITYLDPTAGLLEVVVEFVGAPTSSVVVSLQGRATGVTEVFCTVEPLSGGEAPSDEAVTHLLWRTLRGDDPTA